MLCLCFDVAQFDHLHCSIFGTGVQRLPVPASAPAELRQRSFIAARHQIPGGVTRPGCSPLRPAWINHGWADKQPLGRNTKHKQSSVGSMNNNSEGWQGQMVIPAPEFKSPKKTSQVTWRSHNGSIWLQSDVINTFSHVNISYLERRVLVLIGLQYD